LKGDDESVCVYQIKLKNRETYKANMRYSRTEIDGQESLSYTSCDKFDHWSVVARNDGYPREIRHNALNGNFDFSFTFGESGNVDMNGSWKGEESSRKGTFSKRVSLENAMILRRLDLTIGMKHTFDLIQHSSYPNLSALPMYFSPIGIEEVEVPAGKFSCCKVLFSIDDVRGAFFRAYYFVSVDGYQDIIKCVNVPVGGGYELVSISRNGL
jgi:hypothetical protein